MIGPAPAVALMTIRDGHDHRQSRRRARAPSDQVELIHLPVRHPVPSLGSHRFALRSGCRIEEIAIVINEVLYYTLPCIATLAFPEPDQWKKSWETVYYRSLMPHRRSIIDDEQRVKSVSELPPSPPPHGNPGPWTDRVIQEISREFNISPGSLPAQLIVQLGVCEECWPYILKTRRTCQPRRTPGRITLGSSSPSSHAACYLTSIVLSRSHRFSGHTTPTSALPSTSSKMRSLSDLRNG